MKTTTYASDKTGYSKSRSVWNFLANTKEYKSLKWARNAAQNLANQTQHPHGVVSLNGSFRIVRDSADMKPQHRDDMYQPA